MTEEFFSTGTFIAGIVADTHIPDRTKHLHPELISSMQDNGVQLILHAGDISVTRVLRELEEVAPVRAVRGNRDLAFGSELPVSRRIKINGHRVFLTHGHMGFVSYWLDKIQHVVKGYRSDRYLARVSQADTEASVYIFGHSHCAEEIRTDGKLFFNPGSATFALPPETRRSWGLMKFSADSIESRILYLE